jgi:hypothetical protein
LTNKGRPIERMIKRVLKPFIRFLMQKEIVYTSFQDLVKSTYVEVAIETAQIDNKRLTDSRLSLVTGIHRKEIKRIREAIEQKRPPCQSELQASLGAAVMAKWLSHPDYSTDDHQTKPIPLKGEPPSFEALVYSISKDKHFRSLLDDWQTQDIISLHDDEVKLLKQGFVPSKDEDEKLFFAGKNAGALLNTIQHNLSNQDNLMFERSVYYQDLTCDQVSKIEEFARQRNLETLTLINEMAVNLSESSNENLTDKSAIESTENSEKNVMGERALASTSEPRSGFHVGAYFWRETPNHENNQDCSQKS